MSGESETGRKVSRWRRGGLITIAALILAGLGNGVFQLLSFDDSGPKRRVVDVVTLRLVAPPPPPPPPPVEKLPEPPKLIEQPKIEPKREEKPPEPDAPPPAPLALDAKGGPGSDSFGLAGRLGGADYIGGRGGGGTKFGWYANIIQTQIHQALQKDEKLRSGRYRVTLAVWLSPSGRAERVVVTRTTGNREIDSLVQQALATMPPLPQGPPRDMPQPISLRIDARPSQ